ncbi:carboxymuconolactone decarboxylase family protein [Kribbella sp. NPDC050124]|uniref:carboxymuconolactone decarboxylase family protein n=1 Tax=Kribbella sp. NPDC050124 TaxID=3364114 RepID=UPI0037A77C3D
MRLAILNHGYRRRTKLLFAVIRLFSGHPVPDAAKLVFYRPDFYGAKAKLFTHEAMRGPSTWSVADRELMAAYISTLNHSTFCIRAHTATATQAYKDPDLVQAVLTDPDSAPITPQLRATLAMLAHLTQHATITPAHIHQVLAAGASPQQIKDALAVCAAFNTTTRLADAFAFEVLTPESFEAGATYLLKHRHR